MKCYTHNNTLFYYFRRSLIGGIRVADAGRMLSALGETRTKTILVSEVIKGIISIGINLLPFTYLLYY